MTNNVHRRDYLKALGARDGSRLGRDAGGGRGHDRRLAEQIFPRHRIAKIETWSSPDRPGSTRPYL